MMDKPHFTNFLLVIALGALTSSCGKGQADPAAARATAPPTVTLVATGNVNGELEPCG